MIHTSFEKFLLEENEEYIESVLVYPNDTSLHQKVMNKIMNHNIDTGSIKQEIDSKNNKRIIKIFNRSVDELKTIFKENEFASVIIKNIKNIK